MLSIINVSPKTLKKNPWNTNKVSIENEEKLDNSLKEYGIFKPILCRLVDGSLEIIGGEHRVDSAIRLGYDTIPVINLGEMSDDKAKKLGLLDNGRYGNDDFNELQKLITSLDNGQDMYNVLPYSNEEFDNLFQHQDIDFSEIPSFDLNEEQEPEEPTLPMKMPETHTIVKFKIPLEYLQDLNDKIVAKQQEIGIEYGDKLKNAGEALLMIVLGDNYEQQ